MKVTSIHVLTQSECDKLIQLGENNGFHEQEDRTLNAWSSIDVPVDDVKFLWERVKHTLTPIVDEELSTWIPSRMNNRLRYSRYNPGQQSHVHTDVPYIASSTLRTFQTVLVYLNDNFSGGETVFFNPSQSITPVTGTVTIFDHKYLHQGSVVIEGCKYIVRSDILYESKARGLYKTTLQKTTDMNRSRSVVDNHFGRVEWCRGYKMHRKKVKDASPSIDDKSPHSFPRRHYVPRDISLTFKNVQNKEKHVVRSPSRSHGQTANMMASLEKEQPQKGTEHLSEVEEKDATAEGTHLEEQHLVDEDHFNDIHSKPVVQFGSRVRIHHSGTSTLLTSPDAKYNGGSLEQVVGCTTDEAGQEQVFEIIPSDSNHKQGDVLLHGQPFSIKHVNSGLLLFCDANLKSPVTEQAEVSCRSDANEYSTWKIDTDETEILFEQGVTITNVGTGLKLQSGGFSFEAKDGLEVNEVSCSDSGEDWMLIKV